MMELILKPVQIGKSSKGFIVPKRFLDLNLDIMYKVIIIELDNSDNIEGGEKEEENKE